MMKNYKDQRLQFNKNNKKRDLSNLFYNNTELKVSQKYWHKRRQLTGTFFYIDHKITGVKENIFVKKLKQTGLTSWFSVSQFKTYERNSCSINFLEKMPSISAAVVIRKPLMGEILLASSRKMFSSKQLKKIYFFY